MINERLVKSLVGLILLGGTFLPNCGGRIEDHATDTKTNWLEKCGTDDDCHDGFTCLCGVCTIGCATSDACEKFGGEAACFHAECATHEGVCALPDTPLESSVDHDVVDAGETVTCPRLAENYAAMGEQCQRTALDCADGSRTFEDVCGCGCEPNPACDPSQSYVAYGNRCKTIDYDCSDGEQYFTDDCGCGCEPVKAPVCPREPDAYLLLGGECDAAAVDCSPGFEYFRDDCGCGCDPSEQPLDCPREASEYSALAPDCDQLALDCEGYPSFQDECGCGCETPDTPLDCPRELDAYAFLGEQCEMVAIDCDVVAEYFRDDCGCGCEPNPACDPDVTYVARVGACESTDFECTDSEIAVSDDCGCGCKPTVRDVDGGTSAEVDAGFTNPWETCVPPEGTNLETELLLQTTCAELADVHRLVTSEQELEEALALCGPVMNLPAGYPGSPLYVTTVPDRDSARHLYTIEDDAGVHIGLEYAAYCEGARPPTMLFVFQIQGVESGSTITESVCMSDICSGLPTP